MSQRLAVEGQTGFLGGTHPFAVGVFGVDRAQSGVDLDVPKAAEVALLVAAVGESIGAGMSQRFIGGALGIGSAQAEALGLAQGVAAILQGMDGFLYSGHGIKVLRYKSIKVLGTSTHIDEEPALGVVGHVYGMRAVLAHGSSGALLGIEMVLAALARQDLAVAGDFEALSVGFNCFLHSGLITG